MENCALAVVEKYHSECYGKGARKVAKSEAGNGNCIEDDVTVPPAKNVHALCDELGSNKCAVEGMVQKQGFTNLAQAFALAVTMCTLAGRKTAQSALMVVNDGKPSLQNQTNDLVEQRDDKGCSASLPSNRRTRRAST